MLFSGKQVLYKLVETIASVNYLYMLCINPFTADPVKALHFAILA